MTAGNGLPNRRFEFGNGAVDVFRDGELTRIVLSGDLDLSTVGRVRVAVESACENTPANVVVDLSECSITLDELVSPRRSQAVAYPRQVAMYLSRELTDASLPMIGKEFGGRDHTTVIHAKDKITRLIREDRSVYNLVQELTARIKQAR